MPDFCSCFSLGCVAKDVHFVILVQGVLHWQRRWKKNYQSLCLSPSDMFVELQDAAILLVMRPCCDTISEHCISMSLIGGYWGFFPLYCLQHLPNCLILTQRSFCLAIEWWKYWRYMNLVYVRSLHICRIVMKCDMNLKGT